MIGFILGDHPDVKSDKKSENFPKGSLDVCRSLAEYKSKAKFVKAKEELFDGKSSKEKEKMKKNLFSLKDKTRELNYKIQ